MADVRVCMATWARSEPEHLTVTGEGMLAQRVKVPGLREVPLLGMLAGSGWCAFPGASWQEDMPGVWEVAVFPEAAMTRVTFGNTKVT